MLVIQPSIIEIISTGGVLNRLPFAVLTIFVGRLSTRVTSGRFGRISRRPGAQVRSCSLYPHIVGLVQLCSGVFPAGCRLPSMMM